MHGMSCPTCHGPLVSFGRFLCEIDTNTILRCHSCGSELRRSRATFAMFGALGLGFAAAGVRVVSITLHDPTGASLAALALFFVAAPPVFLLLGKFIAWKFVPWKRTTNYPLRTASSERRPPA